MGKAEPGIPHPKTPVFLITLLPVYRLNIFNTVDERVRLYKLHLGLYVCTRSGHCSLWTLQSATLPSELPSDSVRSVDSDTFTEDGNLKTQFLLGEGAL